jgi:hypothetical protein
VALLLGEANLVGGVEDGGWVDGCGERALQLVQRLGAANAARELDRRRGASQQRSVHVEDVRCSHRARVQSGP